MMHPACNRMPIPTPPSSRDLVPGSTPDFVANPEAWIPAPSAGMTAQCEFRTRQ
jgi:hypothetical protein